MNTCRFEMRIKKTGRFQCAVKFGFSGWAYLWAHNDINDPCADCPLKIEGKPLVVVGEIKSSDFGEVAGKRIRRKDWDEIHARGYDIRSNGYFKK